MRSILLILVCVVGLLSLGVLHLRRKMNKKFDEEFWAHFGYSVRKEGE